MAAKKRIFIASDHAGFALKSELKTALPQWEWVDLGPVNGDRVDYPDLAEILAKKVAESQEFQGVLVCGSGIGMSIAANKVNGIRAAVVENPVAARLSREHNHANVLCLGSRFIAPAYGVEIAKTWLETPYDQNPRHLQRIEKIRKMETK